MSCGRWSYVHIQRDVIYHDYPHLFHDYMDADSQEEALQVWNDSEDSKTHALLLLSDDWELYERFFYGLQDQMSRWAYVAEYGLYPEERRRKYGKIYGDRKILRPECFVDAIIDENGANLKYLPSVAWDAVEALCNPQYGRNKSC